MFAVRIHQRWRVRSFVLFPESNTRLYVSACSHETPAMNLVLLHPLIEGGCTVPKGRELVVGEMTVCCNRAETDSRHFTHDYFWNRSRPYIKGRGQKKIGNGWKF